MKFEIAAGKITLTPETDSDNVLLENFQELNEFGRNVEFEISKLTLSGGGVSSVDLTLVIPYDFEDDLTGRGAIVKKRSRCHCCGGPHH